MIATGWIPHEADAEEKIYQEEVYQGVVWGSTLMGGGRKPDWVEGEVGM